ncbi:MAG: NAD(P)-dependent alcohol dehydrogenase [Gammaproteobacteria bacterium AqS3]|nr:NAD(P)-dependent alcohol dehydrogenase [Gammaproteobacteria bacterium AqS3]
MSIQTNEHAAVGYAARSAEAPLARFEFARRALRPDDVMIDITHCGICHSDLHAARNDWGRTQYPIVPGHEIVGVVSALGSEVQGHRIGDQVAVGCMVDSCGDCGHCSTDLEQYCLEGMVGTYNGKDRHDGSTTFGGYSDKIVVRDEFVLRVPEGLGPAEAAPLLCAGITSYSPLRTWKVGPGDRVAVAGLGGLGHVGVKLAAAMGAEVTVLTRSPGKAEDCKRLGAHEVIISSDRDAMRAAANRFDLILDTIPVRHQVSHYLPLLKVDRPLVIVGMIEMMPELHTGHLLGRRILTGSGIGGLRETQEMLDFCAEKGVAPDIEIIQMHEVNEAYDRLENADVRYRFVIDLASLKREASG